ncbi:hypothetical protein Tco_1537975 [Tanacetum coccineum]
MAVPKDHLRRFHGWMMPRIWEHHDTIWCLEKGYDRLKTSYTVGLPLVAGVSDEDANSQVLAVPTSAWGQSSLARRNNENIDTLPKPLPASTSSPQLRKFIVL